jgi:FAD/FMN-containing dehydrogenase
LALVTEATLRLYPRLPCQATLLAPFASPAEVTAAVPQVVASGVGLLILEYIDKRTMAVIAQGEDMDLGIPGSVRESAQAYLLVEAPVSLMRSPAPERSSSAARSRPSRRACPAGAVPCARSIRVPSLLMTAACIRSRPVPAA